jgi:hypothetical protein
MQTKVSCKVLKTAMVDASALMEAEEILDHESSDYVRGFLRGYYHCMKLTRNLDAIYEEEEEVIF